MIGSIKTALTTFKKFLRYGIPSHILYFGDSLGDNLLLTTLTAALNDRGHRHIWIKCNHPELFENNSDIKLVVPFNALLSTPLLKIFKVKILRPAYTEYQPAEDRDLIPDKHIILKMADEIALKGLINNKPILNLSDDEKTKGSISTKQIVISTATSSAKIPMKNKEWIVERYQQIVDKLSPEYHFIQLGAKDDVPLDNVLDLRGKTTIRESAAVLNNAMLMITHVGFMMHLARAVDCRSVVIYGGRETPEQSGYACFQNIYSAVECSPCWLQNKCDHQKKCMTLISADRVEMEVLNQLQLSGIPLPIDRLNNE